MSRQKVVILNGADSTDDRPEPPLSLLISLLKQDQADIQCYHLQDIPLAHCTGCFGCWIKAPGQCVTADQGREIARSVINSDILILFTPVTFGGYASALKIMLDRLIPLMSPFFQLRHGEIHHLPRYRRHPRLIGIGLGSPDTDGSYDLFQTLVGRNAVNLLVPSYAAEVLDAASDVETLNRQLREVMARSDPWPPENLIDYFPKVDDHPSGFPDRGNTGRTGRVLLIIGSPKINQRSTSAILGEYLLEKMAAAGWETATLTLKADLKRDSGQKQLSEAVDRADLIVLAFPLYVDALPFLMTRALEVLAAHRRVSAGSPGTPLRRLFVLINNGFPEYHQNALALAICRDFADQSGFSWAGALALGSGEALGGERDLHLKTSMGLPRRHIRRALDTAATRLAANRPVTFRAQKQIGKTPLPLMPFGMWRWIFIRVGHWWWLNKASKNALKKRDLAARPYAD